MTAPNIVAVSSIFGKTAVANVTTISSNIVQNVTNSNAVLKINSLIIANIDGSAAADISASLYRDGFENRIAHTVTVPADATLVVISKDTSMYLEEGDAISLFASANNDLWATCSYEEIK